MPVASSATFPAPASTRPTKAPSDPASSRSAWRASPGPPLAEHCLKAHRIMCRAADGHTAVRFSFHAFNDASDVQAAVNALEDFPR